MKTRIQQGKSAPRASGWVLASMGILLLVVAGGVSSVILGELRQKTASAALEKGMKAGEWISVTNEYKHITYSPGLLERLMGIVLSAVSDWKRPEISSSKPTYRILSLLNARQIDSARKAYNSNTVAISRASKELFDHPGDPRSKQSYEITQAVEKLFQSYIQADKKIDLLEAQQGEVEDNREHNLTRLSEIALDTANFFSLKPDSETDKGELPVYRGGLLRDLPRVANIPDDLIDAKELKAALKSARGKVSIYGQDAHLEFARRLDALKTATRAVISTKEQLDRNSTEIAEQLEELVYEKAQLVEKLELSMQNLLLLQLSPAESTLYDRIRQHLS